MKLFAIALMGLGLASMVWCSAHALPAAQWNTLHRISRSTVKAACVQTCLPPPCSGCAPLCTLNCNPGGH